jgi:Dimethlysulfonioproprionate lyase
MHARKSKVTTIFDELLGEFQSYLSGIESARVRDFLGGIDWNMPARNLDAHRLPCLGHLPRLAVIAGPGERRIAGLLARHAPALRWGQTYTAADFGQYFIDNYGWVELFGTRGHFRNDAVAAGVLVLGPNVVYPDHHHVAEEVYVPLTGGTEWRMGEGAFRDRRGSEIIHHASNVSHAMRTGKEPLLALYLWRGGDLTQKSTVAAAGRGAR